MLRGFRLGYLVCEDCSQNQHCTSMCNLRLTRSWIISKDVARPRRERVSDSRYAGSKSCLAAWNTGAIACKWNCQTVKKHSVGMLGSVANHSDRALRKSFIAFVLRLGQRALTNSYFVKKMPDNRRFSNAIKCRISKPSPCQCWGLWGLLRVWYESVLHRKKCRMLFSPQTCTCLELRHWEQ